MRLGRVPTLLAAKEHAMQPTTDRHTKMLVAAGSLLRAARRDAGLVQQDIANLFGVQRDAISKIEKGETDISLYMFMSICENLKNTMPADHPVFGLLRDLMPAPASGRRK
jgi:transcriptional regulator with XRE-family HTH domain